MQKPKSKKMKSIKLSIALLTILGLASCQKELSPGKVDTNATISANSMRQIHVPVNFDWKTTKEVQLKVNVADPSFGSFYHKIEVFSADPKNGGRKLAQGSGSLNEAFLAKVSIPATLTELFVCKVAPDNSQVSQVVSLNGHSIELSLGSHTQKKMGKTAGPDCSSGCSSTVSMTANRTVSSGTVCITNNNISGNLTISGSATVRICGSGTIGTLSMSSGSTLILTSTANVTFNQKITSTGTITNYGTLATNNQDLDVTSGTFTNNGTLDIGNDFHVKIGATFINNGTTLVDNDHQTDLGSTTNNCYMLVRHSLELNGPNVNSPVYANNGYLRVNNNSNINDKASMTNTSGAMFRTNSLQLQVGKIIGDNISGQSSLVKVVSSANINSSGRITGSIQYCAPTSAPSGVVSSGAAAGCNLYIATSSCNPDGNGSPTVTDSDGDGVSDNNDDYPNDATKAYDNEAIDQTFAFEDLWPSLGDYDMNDVVMAYSANVITNASNVVVRFEGHYTLKATGGSFSNGFAVQFPIARNKVSSLTGATLEAGQTNAVCVLFNDMRQEASAWNTITGQATCADINYHVNFNVSNGPSLSTFGLGAYNPFIWNNTSGFGRGYEIHLPGQQPTDLANRALFGTISDGTNTTSGDTYVSNNGRYPWAISIPATFNYPKETMDITGAYTKFAQWVSSGGASYTDWYTNTSGYRNTSKIY